MTKRIRPLNSDLSIFRFLEVVDLEIVNTGLWWTGEDIDAPGVSAAIFRGYSDSSPNERAYILVADVTQDLSEPEIVNLTVENLSVIDKVLEDGVRKACASAGLDFLKWMKTHRNIYANKETVLSAYIVSDPEIGGQQRMALRFMHNGRKILIESAFQVDHASSLAEPMLSALHVANFV